MRCRWSWDEPEPAVLGAGRQTDRQTDRQRGSVHGAGNKACRIRTRSLLSPCPTHVSWTMTELSLLYLSPPKGQGSQDHPSTAESLGDHGRRSARRGKLAQSGRRLFTAHGAAPIRDLPQSHPRPHTRAKLEGRVAAACLPRSAAAGAVSTTPAAAAAQAGKPWVVALLQKGLFTEAGGGDGHLGLLGETRVDLIGGR